MVGTVERSRGAHNSDVDADRASPRAPGARQLVDLLEGAGRVGDLFVSSHPRCETRTQPLGSRPGVPTACQRWLMQMTPAADLVTDSMSCSRQAGLLVPLGLSARHACQRILGPRSICS